MFANRSQQPVGVGHLYEFKAGRSQMGPGSTAETRKVVASPEQGLIYIKHSQEDQLLHFCWKNRLTNNVELDLIIFPGETEFLRIVECKDGRVFMLKFKNSDERHLFWLQEQPDDTKDEEIKKKVNELLTNVQPARTPARNQQPPLGSLNSAAALNNALGGNLEDLGTFGNMDQNQLMRLISMMNGGGNAADLLPHLGQLMPGGQQQSMTPLSALMRRGTGGGQSAQSATIDTSDNGGGRDTTTPSREISSSTPPVSAHVLSQIISALPAASSTADKQKRHTGTVDLSTMLTRKSTSEVVSKYKELLSPLLPDQKPMQSADAELAQTVGNPQFQQAADFIGAALQLGQLGDALEQFQLNKEVVESAKKGDIMRFAEKLTAQENPQKVEIDKQIEAEADAEENVETALKREAAAAAAKKEEEEKAAAEKKPPPHDDNMDLD